MFMFNVFSKKLDVSTRLYKVEQDFILLQSRVSALEYENDTLRNKVLRKIQHKNIEEEVKPLKAGQKLNR